MSDPQKLAPCPFCNGTDIAPLSRNNGHVDLIFLVCNTCEAEGPCSALGGTAKAIERWNRRATPPEDNRLRKALVELLEASVFLAARHEASMAVWRDKLSADMLAGMRTDLDRVLAAGVTARAALSHGEDDNG